MKTYFFVITIVLLAFTCSAQPVIKFEKPSQHLGFVHQGDTVIIQYIFTNTGNEPLVISDTKVQCSCTIVEKPVAPILPGKQGLLKALFITATAIDRQDRTIIVTCNASNSPVELRFKCVVLKAKKKAE